MLNVKKKKGFTLVETAIVLGIATFMGFVAFTQFLKQEEVNKAGMAGTQIRLVGDSVNAYISNHYDSLSTLTNASGTSTDLGPRNCIVANNTCTITVQTLVNEGLLPSSYSGKNVYGSGYNIILKRSGTSPYYHIYGMVTTASPLTIAGSSPRYDLLGQAMQKAGIDSGMTRNSSSMVSGYNGAWTANSTDYTNINQLGLLAYQAGYGTYNYSVFLRRDGTLPMTGNLNMGANSINNSVDYNGTGNINTGGRVVAGSEVSAKNGYGDTITMGGDAAGNDYEIRLGSPKPLTIYSPNAAANTTVFTVGGNAAVSGRLGTNGIDPNDIPANWGGGIRTFDVISSGTIAVIKGGTPAVNGNIASYMNLNGDIYSSNTVNTSGTMYAQRGISTGGDINASGNISGNGLYGNYLHSNGDIAAAGNVSGNGVYGNYVQSNGDVYSAGQTRSNGRMTTNEFLQLNGVANEGWGCSPNGLQGRNGAGAILSCVNGVWRTGGSLQQNSCYWTGNYNGRDFSDHSCAVGEYAAGLMFVGHQHSESAYVIKCCR